MSFAPRADISAASAPPMPPVTPVSRTVAPAMRTTTLHVCSFERTIRRVGDPVHRVGDKLAVPDRRLSDRQLRLLTLCSRPSPARRSADGTMKGMPNAALSASTRQRIITAVLRIIGEGGVAAVTNRRIAREAGVSLGSVTYHFETQHDLLRESLLHFVREE